jgi:hypothetical protein
VIAKRVGERTSLSEDTIRRDLREMAAEGLLKRVHGGAMPISPELADFSTRRDVSLEAKQRLGAKGRKPDQAGPDDLSRRRHDDAEMARQPATQLRHDRCDAQPDDRCRTGASPTAEVVLIGGGSTSIRWWRPERRRWRRFAASAGYLLSRGDGRTSGARAFDRGLRGGGHQAAYRPLFGRNMAALIMPSGMAPEISAPYRQKALRIIEA